jgi:hypothetical protein
MFRPLRTRASALTAAAAFAIVASTQARADWPAPTALPDPQSPAAGQPAAGGQQPPSGATRVNADAALAAEFTKRVQEYLEIHEKALEVVPKLPKETTPQQIDQHQRALGRAIEKLRPKAVAGEIFTKETRAYFRRQLARVFAGAEGRKLRADILEAIMEENPGPIRLRVNGRYPDTVPVSTMPPQVLAALPKLPEDLEYRFIGERMILLDVPAHLVVDYIDDALPK